MRHRLGPEERGHGSEEAGWNDRNTVAVSASGARKNGELHEHGCCPHPSWPGLTAAETIKTVRPDLHVIVLSGDGDLASIGGNHLLHTSRRNPDITVFCNDNEIYGLTGGQAGPRPKGNENHHLPARRTVFPPSAWTHPHGAGSVFLCPDNRLSPQPFQGLHSEALKWKGFSFVDIMSDCIELNGRRLDLKRLIRCLNGLTSDFISLKEKEPTSPRTNLELQRQRRNWGEGLRLKRRPRLRPNFSRKAETVYP